MTPAPKPDSSLFHGIVVLIDDEIDKPTAGITVIQKQIEAVGCHVVKLSELPEDESIDNLRSISFCVLDWNLYSSALQSSEGEAPISVPPELRKQYERANVDFLKKLKKVCVAPVFIFTNEEISEVEAVLKEHHELYDVNDPSHILVRSKGDVRDSGVFNVLSDWMVSAPSVYVLKKWERAYEQAKNELFLDFYNKTVLWPLVLWTTYKEDTVDGSVELGNLIGRNLLSRMTPFHFDLDPYEDAVKTLTAETMKDSAVVFKVLEGERFLPKERLQDDSIAPGDVFKKGSEYFINIRPDCDCIAREGTAQDEVEIYLLEGSKLSPTSLKEKANAKYGTISERDTESIVFGMHQQKTFAFQFKKQTTGKWGDWKNRRIGRLLPPFLTRLQQRYSAYLQRPGVTRIPSALMPPERITASAAASQAGTTQSRTPEKPADSKPKSD